MIISLWYKIKFPIKIQYAESVCIIRLVVAAMSQTGISWAYISLMKSEELLELEQEYPNRQGMVKKGVSQGCYLPFCYSVT